MPVLCSIVHSPQKCHIVSNGTRMFAELLVVCLTGLHRASTFLVNVVITSLDPGMRLRTVKSLTEERSKKLYQSVIKGDV